MAQKARDIRTVRSSIVPVAQDGVRLVQLKRELALLRNKLIRERGTGWMSSEPSGQQETDAERD